MRARGEMLPVEPGRLAKHLVSSLHSEEHARFLKLGFHFKMNVPTKVSVPYPGERSPSLPLTLTTSKAVPRECSCDRYKKIEALEESCRVPKSSWWNLTTNTGSV